MSSILFLFLEETKQLVFHLQSVEAVKNLTFGVFEKKIFGLVGHKKSGRTTTIRMIMGRVTPSSGRIVVAGEDMRPKDPKAFSVNGI